MKPLYPLFIFIVLALIPSAVYAYVEPELCTAAPSINYHNDGNSMFTSMNLSSDCPLPGDGTVYPSEILWDYTVFVERSTFYSLDNQTVYEFIYSANYSSYEYNNSNSSNWVFDITGFALKDYHKYRITIILHGEKGKDEFLGSFNSGWVNAEKPVKLNPDVGGSRDDLTIRQHDNDIKLTDKSR